MKKRLINETPIFQKIYALIKKMALLCPEVPKMHRYTLWERCELRALALLETLIAVGHAAEPEGRTNLLLSLSQEIDTLKVLVRLAKECRAIDLKAYLALEKILGEVGRMVGGWLKSAGSEKLASPEQPLQECSEEKR